MPAGVRAFAEYQPFSSIIDTFRSLLIGTPMGHHGLVAVAWCAGIALVGFVWAVKLYNRDSPMAA
jgi:ABC-2 type transport system permease protein